MVSCKDQQLVYDIKLSSVGPSRVTGSDVVHETSGRDLAMKLHYLKGVYFFDSQASQGLTIMRIKESMFYWLNDYYMTCGRFRTSGSGRPYLKCNDCGVRIVEARCDLTVDEWLEMRNSSLNSQLVYHLPIGPELSISPPLYIQITKFKCGGMSVGISWAHVLGDPFSAADCMSAWGKFLAGLKSNRPLKVPTKSPSKLETPESAPIFVEEPLPLKRVDPVGHHWVVANSCKMSTFSIHLTVLQVSNAASNVWGQRQIKGIPIFESLCAIIWQCVAKVRGRHEPKAVTLCKKDPNYPKDGALSNNQIVSAITAGFSVADSDLKELAALLVDQATDEKSRIEEAVERGAGVPDYIVYGANLTFVDLEKANLYGLEWNGHKPEFVHYTIEGVGDEGAVLVLPWPKDSDADGNEGKVVTFILPEDEIGRIKFELENTGFVLRADNE